MKKLSLFLVCALLVSLLSVGFFNASADVSFNTDHIAVTEGTKEVVTDGVNASFSEMHWGGRVSYSQAVSLRDFSITLKDVVLDNASQYYGGLLFGFTTADNTWITAGAGEGVFFKLIREGNATFDTWQSYAVAGGTDLVAMTKYDVFSPAHTGTNVDYSTVNFWVKQNADGDWSFGINDFTGNFTDAALKAVLADNVDLDNLYFAVGIPAGAPITQSFTVAEIGKTPSADGGDAPAFNASDLAVTEGTKTETANGVNASFSEMHWGGRVSYSQAVSLRDFSITLKDVVLDNASQYYGGLLFGFTTADNTWITAGAGEGVFFKLIREGNATFDTWQSYAVAGGTDLVAMSKYDVFSPAHTGTNVDYSTVNFWVKQNADGNWSFGINDFTGNFTDAALKAVLADNVDLDNLYFAVGIPAGAPITQSFTVAGIGKAPELDNGGTTPDPEPEPEPEPEVLDVPAVDVNQSAYESLALHVLETGDLLDTIANPAMTTIGAKTDNGIPVEFLSHWGCRALYTPEMIPVDGLRVVLKDVQFSAPGAGSGIMFSLNKAGVWIGAEEKQGLFFRVRNVLATVDGQEVVKSYFGVMGSPGMYSNTYIGDEVMLGTNLDLSTLVFTFIRNADGSWTAAINGKGVTFSHEALTAAFDGDFIKTSLEFGQNSSTEVTTKFSVYSVEQLKQLFDYSGADDKSLPAPPALTETKAPYYVQDGDVVNFWNVAGASVGDWTENGVLCVVDQMHWGARFLFADSFTTFHGLKIVLKDLELDHNSPGAGWMFGFEDEIGSYLTEAGFYVRIMANEKNGTNYPTIDVSTVGAVNVGKFGDIFPTTPLTHRLLEEYLEIHFTVSEDGSTLHMYVNGDTFDVPTEPLARWMDAECWFEFSPSYSGFVSQKACLYEVSNMFDEPEEDNGDEGDDEIILPGLDGDNENEKPSDDNKPSEDDEDEKPSDEKPGTSPGTGVASFAGVALLAAAVSAGAAFTTRKRRK